MRNENEKTECNGESTANALGDSSPENTLNYHLAALESWGIRRIYQQRLKPAADSVPRIAVDTPTIEVPTAALTTINTRNPPPTKLDNGEKIKISITEAEKLHRVEFFKERAGVVASCTRCALHRGRIQSVYGDGDPFSRLLFVGEGPGVEEDRQGIPFAGEAGKLLNKMILAMGFRREEVYICNVVKCRPPDNRNPDPSEAASCNPFLMEQILTIAPEVIVALGVEASTTLLGRLATMSQLRGNQYEFQGIPLICTYHPAHLLRTPEAKKAAWIDLQEAMKILAKTPLEKAQRKNIP